MQDKILEVQNLKKYFKTARGTLHAVDDVSFSIRRGETLGVVGESGCGKSTLGRTVIHLLERTSGQIIFDGKDISDVTKSELKALRRDVQMIFQDPFSSLNPRMSVSQIIAEPLIIYKACANKVVKHISDDILVMYLGTMVEFASAKDMFVNRLHPYTKALLAAVPIPEIFPRGERKLLQGELTSPINPKPGCRFAARCPYATDLCRQEAPALNELLPGHFVACHHAAKINDLPANSENRS